MTVSAKESIKVPANQMLRNARFKEPRAHLSSFVDLIGFGIVIESRVPEMEDPKRRRMTTIMPFPELEIESYQERICIFRVSGRDEAMTMRLNLYR
jgi:hypothetical protein